MKEVPWHSMTFLGVHELRKSSSKPDTESQIYGDRIPITHCWGLMPQGRCWLLSTCPDHCLFNITLISYSSVSHIPFHSLLLSTFSVPKKLISHCIPQGSPNFHWNINSRGNLGVFIKLHSRIFKLTWQYFNLYLNSFIFSDFCFY